MYRYWYKHPHTHIWGENHILWNGFHWTVSAPGNGPAHSLSIPPGQIFSRADFVWLYENEKTELPHIGFSGEIFQMCFYHFLLANKGGFIHMASTCVWNQLNVASILDLITHDMGQHIIVAPFKCILLFSPRVVVSLSCMHGECNSWF